MVSPCRASSGLNYAKNYANTVDKSLVRRNMVPTFSFVQVIHIARSSFRNLKTLVENFIKPFSFIINGVLRPILILTFGNLDFRSAQYNTCPTRVLSYTETRGDRTRWHILEACKIRSRHYLRACFNQPYGLVKSKSTKKVYFALVKFLPTFTFVVFPWCSWTSVLSNCRHFYCIWQQLVLFGENICS